MTHLLNNVLRDVISEARNSKKICSFRINIADSSEEELIIILDNILNNIQSSNEIKGIRICVFAFNKIKDNKNCNKIMDNCVIYGDMKGKNLKVVSDYRGLTFDNLEIVFYL